MIAWRIAHQKFADLSGTGGLHVAGRWHSKGRFICYLAEHPALAMLEVRVHMDLDDALLSKYVLMKVDIDNDLVVATFDNVSGDEDMTQAAGDSWLTLKETAVAKAPSAISPESFNLLVNPLHHDAAGMEVLSVDPLTFDLRLFQ